jgi:hypothetical protein
MQMMNLVMFCFLSHIHFNLAHKASKCSILPLLFFLSTAHLGRTLIRNTRTTCKTLRSIYKKSTTAYTVSSPGSKVKKPLQAENNCNPYPAWVCGECAVANQGTWPKGHIATFHSGRCGWCGEIRAVTQPRDYGYPDTC